MPMEDAGDGSHCRAQRRYVRYRGLVEGANRFGNSRTNRRRLRTTGLIASGTISANPGMRRNLAAAAQAGRPTTVVIGNSGDCERGSAWPPKSGARGFPSLLDLLQSLHVVD